MKVLEIVNGLIIGVQRCDLQGVVLWGLAMGLAMFGYRRAPENLLRNHMQTQVVAASGQKVKKRSLSCQACGSSLDLHVCVNCIYDRIINMYMLLVYNHILCNLVGTCWNMFHTYH